jgi:ribonuclease VapC
MKRVVLDSSAILASIIGEPGAEVVLDMVGYSAVSAVNMAEIKGKLVSRGWLPNVAWHAALNYSSETFPFDSEQASIAGGLVATTKHYGLSLGDRACLALALVLDAPVYTADKAWARIDLGVKIHMVR